MHEDRTTKGKTGSRSGTSQPNTGRVQHSQTTEPLEFVKTQRTSVVSGEPSAVGTQTKPGSVAGADLSAQGNISLSADSKNSSLLKSYNWLKDAYVSKGGTLLIGLGASCFSLPASWGVGSLVQDTWIPKGLGGVATLLGSMIVWDVLYSAGLWYFYDRNDIKTNPGENSIRQQIKKYAINCLEADVGWVVSYQALYAICALGFDMTVAGAAACSHGFSILIIDLLRPPLLKLNKTLVRDQN